MLITGNSYGQTEIVAPEIKMTTEFVKNREVQDLMQFENINFYYIYFTGISLIGKDYVLVSKEIWDGKITKIDTLIDTSKSSYIGKLENDTLKIKVIAKKTYENNLKVHFRFPRLGITKKFDAINSDAYLLRNIGINVPIIANKKFYALAYILPYEKDGTQRYCAVENSGVDVEMWGKKFNIKHYVLFEMEFKD